MTARWQGPRGAQDAWRDRVSRGGADNGASGYGSPPAARGLTGIGDILREAREARGISFETAEHDTHIPRHHLQSLEEERFESLHAPVYVRGFLRSYSQYLGLDSRELLSLLPVDRPLEEERLMPLSRLGRPRGPREAARERRDPIARDAQPLTSTPFPQRQPALYDDGPAVGPAVRARPGADDPSDLGAPRDPRMQAAPRLDPLGRLGWPEQIGEPSPRNDMAADVARADAAESARRPLSSGWSREQPLSASRPHHWTVSSRWRGPFPQDTRALFTAGPLAAIVATAGALLVLLAFTLALDGRGPSPTIFATAAPSAVANTPNAVAVSAVSSGPVPHGTMPNLRGVDLSTALVTLKNSGVVPVVIGESGGDLSSQRVATQVPSAGSQLGAQTSVMLVVAGGSQAGRTDRDQASSTP